MRWNGQQEKGFSSPILPIVWQRLERKASIVKRRKGDVGEVRIALVAV